jgi:uncharacterized protein (TIGR02118 family)
MEKLILFVKRKPGLSQEQFRDHYENTHAPLAWSNLRPWLINYTRNYLTPLPGQTEPPYDCVTEFWFADRAALDASIEWARSEVGQILSVDEENFMDRASMQSFIACEAHCG